MAGQRFNSGQVSEWGITTPPIVVSAAGAISAPKQISKNGLPGISLIWGTASATYTQNLQYAYPFVVFDEIRIDAYLSRPAAGSATAVVKTYVYKMDANTFASGTTASFMTGTDATIDVTAGGNVTTLLASAVTLNPGCYLLLFHCTGATSPQMWSVIPSNNFIGGSNVQDGTGSGGNRGGIVIANNSAAPASSVTFSSSGATINVPVNLRWL